MNYSYKSSLDLWEASNLQTYTQTDRLRARHHVTYIYKNYTWDYYILQDGVDNSDPGDLAGRDMDTNLHLSDPKKIINSKILI